MPSTTLHDQLLDFAERVGLDMLNIRSTVTSIASESSTNFDGGNVTDDVSGNETSELPVTLTVTGDTADEAIVTVPVQSNSRCVIQHTVDTLNLTLPNTPLDFECIIVFTTSKENWTLTFSNQNFKLVNSENVEFTQGTFVMCIVNSIVAFAPIGTMNYHTPEGM